MLNVLNVLNVGCYVYMLNVSDMVDMLYITRYIRRDWPIIWHDVTLLWYEVLLC